MTNAQLLQEAFGYIDDEIIDRAVNTYVSKRRFAWPAIIAAAAAVIVLVLSVTSSIRPGERILQAKYYGIYVNDGAYTIESEIGGSSGGGLSVALPGYSVKFTGLAEMRRIIFEGQLSDRALRAMRGFPRDKYGDVLLFDPNNMQDIVVPEDIRVGLIRWFGCAYQFDFSNDTISGSLTYDMIDDSENRAEDEIQKENNNVTILSVSHDPERNATVTVFQYIKNQLVWKQIVYTHTVGNKAITFVETYRDGAEQEVPDSISFWGTDNGNYFYGGLKGMTERPSLEYLMQFGLKLFVEE